MYCALTGHALRVLLLGDMLRHGFPNVSGQQRADICALARSEPRHDLKDAIKAKKKRATISSGQARNYSLKPVFSLH
jgi:hypothetical protein